jgi:hypothetical protein
MSSAAVDIIFEYVYIHGVETRNTDNFQVHLSESALVRRSGKQSRNRNSWFFVFTLHAPSRSEQ